MNLQLIPLSLLPVSPQECWDCRRGSPQPGLVCGFPGENLGHQAYEASLSHLIRFCLFYSSNTYSLNIYCKTVSILGNKADSIFDLSIVLGHTSHAHTHTHANIHVHTCIHTSQIYTYDKKVTRQCWDTSGPRIVRTGLAGVQHGGSWHPNSQVSSPKWNEGLLAA